MFKKHLLRLLVRMQLRQVIITNKNTSAETVFKYPWEISSLAKTIFQTLAKDSILVMNTEQWERRQSFDCHAYVVLSNEVIKTSTRPDYQFNESIDLLNLYTLMGDPEAYGKHIVVIGGSAVLNNTLKYAVSVFEVQARQVRAEQWYYPKQLLHKRYVPSKFKPGMDTTMYVKKKFLGNFDKQLKQCKRQILQKCIQNTLVK